MKSKIRWIAMGWMLIACVAFLGVPQAIAQEELEEPPIEVEPGVPGGEMGEDLGGEYESIVPGELDFDEEEGISVEPEEAGERPVKAPLPYGDVPEVYTIQQGDTLWDICQKFLDNPWYWPKLWSLNQYISNPHLIFPGDQLVFFSGSETAPPRLDIVGDEKKPEDSQAPEIADKTEEPTIILPTDEEVFIRLKNLGFITSKKMRSAGRISHSGDQKKNLSAGDRLYLDFKKNQQVVVGDRFHVFERIQTVKDPNKIFGKLGYQIRMKAVVKIIAIHRDTVEGIITDSEKIVTRGDRVIPYEDPVRKLTPHDSSELVEGKIVASEHQQFLISNNDFVYVNLGTQHGMSDGLRLYVVRRGDGVFQGGDSHLPDVVVARLLVVKAEDKTSSAYVMDLRDSLSIGDRVVTAAK